MRVFLFLLSTLLVLISQAKAQETPNIVGNWLCVEQAGAFPQGVGESGYEFDFIVTEQKGPAFKGHVDWIENPEDVPDLKKAIRNTLSESEEAIVFRAPIFGVFGLGPGQFAFSETGDPGYHFGQFIDDDTIEFMYLESGPHAFAALRKCDRVNQ